MDVPNTFIHTYMSPKKYIREILITKLTDLLVDMLVELDSETYRKHTLFENGKKVIYVFLLREIYGRHVAALLLYKKFSEDLVNTGFDFNPYNTCVANRIKIGKQHTVILNVDKVIFSNVNPNVNYKFKEWMNYDYGNHGEGKANRGKLHKYLEMNFDFT